MTWELFPRSKKQRNRETAERRKAKGDVSEDIEAYQATLHGRVVTQRDQRKGEFDHYETPVNIIGQRTGSTKHVEVKSNSWNKETDAQLRRKRWDRNYERRDVNIDSIPGAGVAIDGKVLENRFRRKKMNDILFGQ